MPKTNDIVSSKVYDKRDDIDFEMVSFPCFGGSSFLMMYEGRIKSNATKDVK